jgi:serine/threonine-protein kinase
MVRRIGRYEVLAELGRGGFGQVYRCLDPSLGTPVAIKILTADGDEGMMVRFRNEAATSRRLRHPNIIAIYDFGEQNSVPYIVMELLEGEDLHRVIEKRKPLSLLQKIGIMSQMASGLGHAHNEGVIHRDVKPANVMLLRDGTVKIMDFGIALITQATQSRLTPRGAVIGTLRYMAPEQFRGTEPDARSDIFSYGLIFYELLSGVHPFYATDAAAQMYNILSVEPAPISRYVPDFPAELQSVLARLLCKDPDLRHQSLDDVLVDLEPALQKLRERRSIELINEARAAKAQSQLEKAHVLIREALTLTPASEQARELREQLQGELRRQAIRPRVEDLVKRAREALASGNPTEAAQGFESAIRLDPLDTTLQGLLEEARTAAEHLQEAMRLLAEAEGALANGDAASAANFARQAVERAPAAGRPREVLEQAETVLADENRRTRFAEDSAAFRRLIENHSWQEASDLLAGLNRDFPDHSEVRRLSESLDFEQKREEDERRLAGGLAAARARFRDGDLSGALTGLESLSLWYPDSAEVGSMLAEVRSAIAAKRQREVVSRGIEEAQRLAARDQFEEAVQALDGALAQYPADPDLQRERQAIVAASCDAAWSSAIQRAIAQAEELRSQARLAEAVQLLDSFLSSGADAPAIAKLRDSIMEEEAARKDAELRDFVRHVKELIAKDELDSATRLLEVSPTHVKENSEVTRLRDAAEMQKQLRAEKQAALEALSAEVQPLCERGRFDDAMHQVDRFESNYGADAEAGEIRNRIRRDQQKEQQRRAEELHAQATGLLASDPLQATVLLGAASEQLRGRPEIQKLEQAARRAADEQRTREAIAELITRSRSLYAEGRLTEALSVAETGLKTYAGQPDLAGICADVRAAQARQQRELSLRKTIKVHDLNSAYDFEKAERSLTDGLAGDPDNAALLQLRADVRAREQQWRAEQAEQQAAQLRRETYAQGRQRAGAALRSGQFQAAIAALEELLRQFPDDAALKGDLKEAREAQGEQVRRESYAQGRQRAGAALRSGQFQAAIAALEELLRQFPDDAALKGDLKEAREAQGEQVRRESYAQGRQRAGAALRSGQFQAAIAALEELLRQFPDDAPLKGDLKEAREAQTAQVRRESYAQGRQRAGAALRSGQFQAAIAALEELLRQFPDDAPLKGDLKEAREAQTEQVRRERYATERRRAQGLVQARKFDDAIALLQTLLVEFPADAALEEDLKSTIGARDLQQQRETLNREVTQLEKMYRKGDARAVQERASLLSPDLQDARVRELLEWASAELDRPRQEHERESAESLRGKRKQRIVAGVVIAAVAALAGTFIVFELRPPKPPAIENLSVEQSRIDFTLQPGAARSSKTLSLGGNPPGTHWSASSTADWLAVKPAQGVTPAQVEVSVDPSHLAPDSYSAQVLFTSEHASASQSVYVTAVVAAPGAKIEAKNEVKTDKSLKDANGGAVPGKDVKGATPKDLKSQPVIETHPQQSLPPVQPQPVQAAGEQKGAAVQPKPPPDIPDCKAPTYNLATSGTLRWSSLSGLQPNGVLIIGGKDQDLKGGQSNENFPGCEISFSGIPPGIEVVEKPSLQDRYSRVKLLNRTNGVVYSIELKWTSR